MIVGSQVVNTLLGGYPDEMLSSRCYRKKWGTAKAVIDSLFRLLGQENHCKASYEWEKARKDSPNFRE